MPEISATEAARNFADLLDAVEFRGERITIIRRGRAVALVEPVSSGLGADVKALLRSHAVDAGWADSVTATRRLVTSTERF
jgi:prevent-host-death family protein